LKKYLLLLLCIPLTSQELADVLWSKAQLSNTFHYSDISKAAIDLPNNGKSFSGILKVDQPAIGIGYNVIIDSRKIYQDNHKNIPKFEIEISSLDGKVYPKNTKIIETNHLFWNIQFGVGSSKLEISSSNTLITLPFSLIHKSANCIHNGIGVFSISNDNQISNIIFEIASETCAYYKFDYVGLYSANFQFTNALPNLSNNSDKNIISIENLYKRYNLTNKSFLNSDYIDPSNVTMFGLIDSNNHYVSSCMTRLGNYPFCDQILLPSYSLAKSIAGTFSLSLLESQYGSISNLYVSDLVPECYGRKWKNVTLNNLSDMSTGQYFNSIHDFDESSVASSEVIFMFEEHKDKIKKACSAFPKKTKPGTRFVYHTSDTYILGLALNNYLQSNSNRKDYFNDVLIPFLESNNLSQTSQSVLATNDNIKQSYTGWGMFFLRSDLDRLATIIHNIKNNSSTQLTYLYDALNPNDNNSLLAIPSVNIYYNNGFWSRKFDKNIFNCSEDVWIPFMSGFGGITFAFFPNGMSYYYFSDGYEFAWESAIFSSHSIKPFC
tara:strand:- start:1006 stop:2652 length:1647 start_codon:yes stop_codon:yes gene_type:complete